jgi:hypothetical protein
MEKKPPRAAAAFFFESGELVLTRRRGHTIEKAIFALDG